MSSADLSLNLGATYPDTDSARTPVSVALIGPDEERRRVLAMALDESRQADVREFDSYPPELDSLPKLLNAFDVVILDLDSDPDVALEIVKRASVIHSAVSMVYSEQADQKLAVRCMRAGAREFLLLPLEEGIVAEALTQTRTILGQKAAREPQSGDNGVAEMRVLRPRLELASPIAGPSAVQEKKRPFELRGYGRSVDEAASPLTIPTVKWPSPAPITYGDTLTTTQLNATASANGSFVYTPGPGYILPVGTHTLWVTFTAADYEGEGSLQTSVSIVVTKATPDLSWPTPAEITNSTALGETQLNAASSVPGTFEYSPALGEMLPPGVHTLSVTFTPDDIANYATAQTSVSLNVARAKPVIEWSAPGPIMYGTQLSASQLCATTLVPGTFEYVPGSGSLLGAGVHQLSVVFTPEDTFNFSTSEMVVGLTVAKATPVVTWQSPDPIPLGAALSAAQLNAWTSVPGSFVYTPAAGEILAPGVRKLSATFTPADIVNYTKAQAIESITVTEKTPTTITWPVPASISYGTALSSIQLNAEASVSGTFVYGPSEGHVLAPGRSTLSVLFTPADSESYATAQATVVLEVKGLPVNASLPATDPMPTTRTFATINSAPADSEPELKSERIATETMPRETRTYKGAVYEKGDDGQWHLQQN